MTAHRPKLASVALTQLVALTTAAAAFAATLPTQHGPAPAAARHAGGAASGRVYTLPFSARCTERDGSYPRLAPHVLGARARLTVPAAWRTILVPPNTTSSGGSCGQPYLLTRPRRDANLCLQETLYATMAPAARSQTPAAFLGSGHAVLARGRLPAVAGMRGVWEEVDVGETEPAYAVTAAYAAADHRVFYELDVVPPFPAAGCPAVAGQRARGIARQLAISFRVSVSDAATAETYR
jgi:hypothetical protein